MERDEFLGTARQMIAEARLDFFRRALPLCRTDAESLTAKEFADAVGEVSADQALNGFLRRLDVMRIDEGTK
jgi:hypothetical protein